jgi:hypothetical protein
MQGFENAIPLGKQEMRILARLIKLREGKKLRLRANMSGEVRDVDNFPSCCAIELQMGVDKAS